MKPELLSPAGTLKNMRYAFAYGADAVYAGQPRYSLRVRNNDFKLENLENGINEAHAQGKKFYLASNLAPHNSKVKTFLKHMEPVIAMKPDALIMSDPGLIMMVRETWPDMPVHLSVQANVVNFATVKFWAKQGVERIILSRELSLDEIQEIREEAPEMEIEVFVHGSLCIAYSGRCLLSGYINKRDPNQGTCTNACRWEYQPHAATESYTGEVIPLATAETVQPTLGQGTPTDQIVLLQEKGRPDQYMPAFEDEHGTYIMNSKDLRAVQHVHRLTDMGIHSLKIEGRTKSFYYVARTAQVYRKTIDDAAAGRPFDRSAMDTLENLANRGFTEGFYRRHVHDEYQNYETGNSRGSKQQFVGDILDFDGQKATIDVKNRFETGDTMELMTPKGNIAFTLDNIENKHGESVSVAPGSGHKVKIPVPEGVQPDEMSLLVRNLPQ
ncbi:prephenate-dependent tRNA uridine(34) hydroxylase TrhP [Endozoicomonas euniceicola]|uniref:tRNA 5-hydroxyuridine modification protein YegQ n=1 Tax=Endozoicomonas euniceicola TaxID=1234143 RepID=A0ABY6H209_9GAMM|nr:tRNA 5-hydroxyuridine modification protein YegQ [Endozoicomonas euniceicola]UYM18268.1 tRNA 5-hydroxyuridine modification protein YegQ [Endozoicomonas euniceicola]